MSHPPETTGPLHDVLAHQRSLASELKKRAPSGGVIVSLIRGFWAAVAALERHRGHASAEENVDADPRAEAAARWLTSASQTPDHESGRRRYRTLIEGDLTSSSGLEALREHAELCDRVARLLQAEFEDERYGPGRRVLRWLPAALTGLAVVLATYEMFREHIPGVGPWRGAYHSQPGFKGEPDIIRDQDIDFDWGRKSPAPEIPNDKISIRWDSCLTLDDDQTTAFQLVANDGARLYVDDQLVVDVWKKKTRKGAGAKKKARKLDRLSGGAEVRLEAGRHRLRVDYRENVGPARVQLLASFGLEDPPSSIPSGMLTYPGDHPDWSTYCRD